MGTVKSWVIVFGKVVQYLLYRVGIGELPSFVPRYPECMDIVGSVLGWRRHLRIVDAERCPKTQPAIFVGNHLKLDDPFATFRAIYLASETNICVHNMMRDDFFKGIPFTEWRLFDADEFMGLLGAYEISREGVRVSQIKPFVKLLREKGSFLIYPGRTRSRSGLLVEYRGSFQEPGGVAFFVVQARRGHPDLDVAVVPVARTFNPVSKRTTIAFGESQRLADGADRVAQREFDRHLIEVIGDLIEIHVPHVLSAVLYLRCLHRLGPSVEIATLYDTIRGVLGSIAERHIDPAAETDLEGELKRSLKFLRSKGMLRLRKRVVQLDTGAILSVPSDEKAYRKSNPVKYLTNQVMHLADVTAAVEQAVLSA